MSRTDCVRFFACFLGTFLLGLVCSISLSATTDRSVSTSGAEAVKKIPAPPPPGYELEAVVSLQNAPRQPAREPDSIIAVPPAPSIDPEEPKPAVPVDSANTTNAAPAAAPNAPAAVHRQGSAPFIPPAPGIAADETKEIPAVPAQSATPEQDAEWSIAIIPNSGKTPAETPKTYENIYASIPYRRAEYLANPSYRHDTTMEILFGQLRPTVINRTDNPVRVVNPRPAFTQPYPISKGELYSYWPLLQYGSALPLLSPID